MIKQIQFAAYPALLLALMLPGCSQPAQGAERKPIPVKVQTIENVRSQGPARYSGSLEPAAKVDMAFRVGGYVEELGQVKDENGSRSIDKGDYVTKGTVLARVRATDYVQKVKTAKAGVNEARAALTLAREELGRARKLFAGNAITKAELDANVARSDSAEAQLEGAIAQHDDASVSLGDTVLRAPMDGTIISRQIEPGTLISPGQAVVTIADTRTVKAVFGAPQLQVEKLEVGSPVEVFVGAESESKAPEKLLRARVTRIAPAADTNGRVFSVEAALPNESGALRSGAVVSVRIPELSESGEALLVPLRAVIRSPQDGGGFAVFVLDGPGDRARAQLRNVKLGEVIGNGVTVTQGLGTDQRVVTVGANLLNDGSEAIVIR